MSTVLDYSAGVPRAADVKAAGHVGVIRYISPPREAWMKGKPLGRAEVEDMRAHGIGVACVWQFEGERAPDVMRGARGGELDAKAADAHLKTIGLEGWPVFFAVDFNASITQWNETIVHYFRAAVAVLGRDRVGIYGHSRAIDWAREDGVIADLGGGRVLGWQAAAKSWESPAGHVHPGAVLHQARANVPGPGGLQVDVNTVRHAYWGQTRPAAEPRPAAPTPPAGLKPNPKWRGDPTWLPEALRLWGVDVREMDGWRERGQGDFTDIQGVMAHHTGAANTTPEIIAFGHSALRGLLSQIHLDPKGVATICGAGIAYHAGLADPGRGGPAGQGYVTRPSASGPKSYTSGNARYIGIEAQHSGNPRDPWPEEQMEAYARCCAAICWFLGYGTDRVLGHKEYAPSRKVDPTFQMEGFRRRVQWLLDNPPAAVRGDAPTFPTIDAPEAGAPDTKENHPMWDHMLESIINPAKKLSAALILQLLDAYAWKQEVAMRHLFDQLGLDYDGVINAAVEADRRGDAGRK